MKKNKAGNVTPGKLNSAALKLNNASPEFDMSSLGAVRSTALLQALEPRILLDAAGFATGVDAVDQPYDAHVNALVDEVVANGTTAPWLQVDSEENRALFDALAQPSKSEIAFFDSAVDDAEVLIAALEPHVEVRILNAETDGVEQIASVLEGRAGLDAVHLISHGRSGTLDLGSTKLTEASMNGRHADEMAVIRDSLSDSADILIYGCDFGAHARGASAVEALARMTGADIAASEDLTGNTTLGGDLDLEVESGEVETASITSHSYDGVLATLDNTTLGGSGTGYGTNTVTFTVASTGPGDPGNTITIQRTDGGILTQESGLGVGIGRQFADWQPGDNDTYTIT